MTNDTHRPLKYDIAALTKIIAVLLKNGADPDAIFDPETSTTNTIRQFMLGYNQELRVIHNNKNDKNMDEEKDVILVSIISAFQQIIDAKSMTVSSEKSFKMI